MSLINIEGLTFSYPSSYDNIFENVSFQIDTNWKTGFVGRNGRGKTTFLNLLLGKYRYKGNITTDVKFDYFPCTIEDTGNVVEKVLLSVCPHAARWELLRELGGLGMGEEIMDRPFCTLSGGEKTKSLLAALFLNEGRFLLIDEPTNHLDINARRVVAQYLNKKKGFILVSHDRGFLDGCVDHILSINRSDIEIRKGNITSWFSDFEKKKKKELDKNRRLKKDMERIEDAARRASGWSDRAESAKYGTGAVDRGYIGHKAAKMMKRSKAIEQRRERAAQEKSGLLKNIEKADELKLRPMRYHSDRLAGFSDVSVFRNGRRVNTPVAFEILRGDRVALSGANGSGKTSLIKLLIGENLEYDGDFYKAPGLVLSYVPQETDGLCGSIEDYALRHRIDRSLFMAVLRKLDFQRVQFEKDMAGFSMGQKKKVLLAASLCTPAHLYVWDEPLNYIDIYSRMQIENLLGRFQPTMLFIEHDEAFRKAVASKTIEL